MAPKRCGEFVMQIVAMVTTIGAFVSALYAEIKFSELTKLQKDTIQTVSDGNLHNELFIKTEAVAGLVFVSTGVAVIVGIIALIGRICNLKHERSKRRVFFCLYNLYIVSCFLFFAGIGVLAYFTASEWNEVVNDIPTGQFETLVENIRNSLIATVVFCFLVGAMFGILEMVLLCCTCFCGDKKTYVYRKKDKKKEKEKEPKEIS